MGHARCFPRATMLPALPDRRRDRRHRLTGHAVLHPHGIRRHDVFGGLVDVGARGLRVRVRPGSDVEPGDVVDLDLEVCLPASASATYPVRLLGRGRVLRVDLGSQASTEAALAFEAPLAIREGFLAPVAGGS